jgi:hypothetical protein
MPRTAPHDAAWSVETTGEVHHYLFDGRVQRAFVGDRLVSAGVADDGLRSLARFTAVAHLDALRLPGARVAAVAVDDLPPGAAAALDVVLLDDGARYRIALDDRLLVVSVAGPVDVPTLGRGALTARFSDFARAGGRLLPRRTAYRFRDAPLADERALALCVDPPGLDPAAFVDPARLPRCAGRAAP